MVCGWDTGFLKETTPIRTEMLHHQMRGMSQNAFALISTYLVILEFYKVNI